jgi:hypothetical protein
MDIETLTRNGFIPTTYAGQEGIFYVKKVAARDMPYFSSHAVDGEDLLDSDIVVVEVTPGELVQLSVEDSDYYEEPVSIHTEEGLALLRDVGFPC